MEVKLVADLYNEELKTEHNKDLGHSPRAREIMKRKRLNSQDGAIIEEHDQFYRDHKLLLLLFRVCIYCIYEIVMTPFWKSNHNSNELFFL